MAVLRDPGIAEEDSLEELESVGKCFRDKLRPAERWLRSRVGERWDEVYAELVLRFDTRTVPGRHVVYCHMLHFVDGYPFHIDDSGILRERKREGWNDSAFVALSRDRNKARSFTADRRIGLRGSAHFWFLPTFANGEPTGRFRQDRRLTPDEEREWTALVKEARDELAPW